ncbi:MAG: dihydroorotase [Bacteroidetes bacterium]|nr:dihydroorotase [Bacteroidota bacterium]MBL6944202.1 dihydroorotase [Bacteroidales bacterium]
MSSEKKVISGATIVNEGLSFVGDVFMNGNIIESIVAYREGLNPDYKNYDVIHAMGLHLLPGVIDDQVHFRDPGLTYKGDIYTESKAAVAGGITSFMDMPNTIPNCLTQELLEEKYQHAAITSLANYSFYMGASNDNLEEIIKTNPQYVCGIKVFMGASTGNMLVDSDEALTGIFSSAPTLVAVHCEDEESIVRNNAYYFEKYGEQASTDIHPKIRSAEACFLSSAKAVNLAKKYGTRLHVLHLSTEKEMVLFENELPLEEKKITAEVCVHHLWFSEEDYNEKGNFIKWNPAIKATSDKNALLEAVLNNKIDVVATDHAPHTIEEKKKPYFKAPSGGPMVQHSLIAMLEFCHRGKLTLEKVVEKMCHNPAILFNVDKRGFIRPGYKADLVLVDLNNIWTVKTENILYKCGWSPMAGEVFRSKVVSTFVNGNRVYNKGVFTENIKGERLTFNKKI